MLKLTGSGIGAARPRLFLAYAVAMVISGGAVAISQFPQFLEVARSEPRFWLVALLAVLAAWYAFVSPSVGGVWTVISPTVCFTFAILLCWGVGPAVVAQVVAVAGVAWRVRQPPWQAAVTAGQFILAFVAAHAVLLVGDPDPFGKDGPINYVADAIAVVGAVAAWLGAFGVLLGVYTWLWRGVGPIRPAGGAVGYHILYAAALLMLSPVLAVAAHVNTLFVPLVFVPLFAVQRMARLSDERDRAVRLDPLTGLANRAGLNARFDELTAVAARSGADAPDRKLALLVLDLDRFKHVNDALGHQVGDQFLVAVAERLAAVKADGGIVARLGGDEFAILARVSGCTDAHAVGERVTKALCEPATLDGLRLDVTASVGIALLRDHGEDFPTLMRHADVAMYEAKKRGDSIALYEPHVDHNTPERLGMLTDFRRALESKDRDQISLHYQPQISLENGTVVGAEALLRWRHPEYGQVSTQELLQVAEHTSVMHLLTTYVIDEVLAQVTAWEAEGIRLRASLNISARDLYSGDIVRCLSDRLARHDVPPTGSSSRSLRAPSWRTRTAPSPRRPHWRIWAWPSHSMTSEPATRRCSTCARSPSPKSRSTDPSWPALRTTATMPLSSPRLSRWPGRWVCVRWLRASRTSTRDGCWPSSDALWLRAGFPRVPCPRSSSHNGSLTTGSVLPARFRLPAPAADRGRDGWHRRVNLMTIGAGSKVPWHASALVAQGIEQRFPKPCVAGSIPAGGTQVRGMISDLQGCFFDLACPLRARSVPTLGVEVIEVLGHLGVSFVDRPGVVPGRDAAAGVAQPTGGTKIPCESATQLACVARRSCGVTSPRPTACRHDEPAPETVVALLPIDRVTLPTREQERIRVFANRARCSCSSAATNLGTPGPPLPGRRLRHVGR